MTIHSASESSALPARALRAISAPTPAGSPMVTAILGRRTGPPMVDMAAAIEYVDESLAGTEAAGLGDDDAAVCDAALDDAPGNTGSEFTGEQDAGRVERFKNERRGLAAGEDQSGSRGGGKCFANFVVRRAGPVDAVNRAVRRLAMAFEVGYLESGDGVVGADEEKGTAMAMRERDGFAATQWRERGGQGAGETGRSGPEDGLPQARGGCGETVEVGLGLRVAEENANAGCKCAGDSLLERSFSGDGKRVDAGAIDARG